MKIIRIFLLILIIIGIGLICTQNIWVPRLVNKIILQQSNSNLIMPKPNNSSTKIGSPVCKDQNITVMTPNVGQLFKPGQKFSITWTEKYFYTPV